jgi:hypothetical protein
MLPQAVFDSAQAMPEVAARAHPELPRLERLADSLGFDFVMRPPEAAIIEDQRYAATYQAPRGVTAGYILFAPGLRPKLIRNLVTEDELRRLLQDFGALARRMGRRGT